MILRRFALALGLLLAAGTAPARAQTSNCLTTYGSPPNLVCGVDTIPGGADPTGSVDSAPAINAAATTVLGGIYRNVRLPAGTYRLNGPVTIANGQCLYGDGRGLTTLLVDQNFSPSASGVVVLNGREAQGPCVHDLRISFAQPTTQNSRAAFKALTAGCTSGSGGSGCKYPPAIWNDNANRIHVWNVRIDGAWDGIADDASSGGSKYENLEIGALAQGFNIQNQADFDQLSNIEFWDYGFSGTSLDTVYNDGNTVAVYDGSAIDATNISILAAQFQINIPSGGGNLGSRIVNLSLDSSNAFLKVLASPTLTSITNVYATGDATGASAGACQINVLGGTVAIHNLYATSAVDPEVCQNTGYSYLSLSGGVLSTQTTTVSSIAQTNGDLSVTGINFAPASGIWTVPIVASSGAGEISFAGNHFSTAATGANQVGLSYTGSSWSNCKGNFWNGWAGCGGTDIDIIASHASNYPIPIAKSGSSYTNQGAGGEVDFTLPLAAAQIGFKACFHNYAGNTMKTIAAGSDRIWSGEAYATTAGGNVTTLAAVDSYCLTSVSSGVWSLNSALGTLSFN